MDKQIVIRGICLGKTSTSRELERSMSQQLPGNIGRVLRNAGKRQPKKATIKSKASETQIGFYKNVRHFECRNFRTFSI